MQRRSFIHLAPVLLLFASGCAAKKPQKDPAVGMWASVSVSDTGWNPKSADGTKNFFKAAMLVFRKDLYVALISGEKSHLISLEGHWVRTNREIAITFTKFNGEALEKVLDRTTLEHFDKTARATLGADERSLTFFPSPTQNGSVRFINTEKERSE